MRPPKTSSSSAVSVKSENPIVSPRATSRDFHQGRLTSNQPEPPAGGRRTPPPQPRRNTRWTRCQTERPPSRQGDAAGRSVCPRSVKSAGVLGRPATERDVAGEQAHRVPSEAPLERDHRFDREEAFEQLAQRIEREVLAVGGIAVEALAAQHTPASVEVVEERHIADEHAPRPEDALDLTERDAGVRKVLEGLREHDRVESRVRKRKRSVEIDPLDVDPVLRVRRLQRPPVDVAADDPVPLPEVAAEGAAAAAPPSGPPPPPRPPPPHARPFRPVERPAPPPPPPPVAPAVMVLEPPRHNLF